jgi:GR25 family glycosyltransferase involved in LPS biosynthesis
MTIPFLVLNLKTSTKRRADIAARLSGLSIDHRFFAAISGRSLSEAELERLAPRSRLCLDRPLTANEIACAAGHTAMIRQLAENGGRIEPHHGPDRFHVLP